MPRSLCEVSEARQKVQREFIGKNANRFAFLQQEHLTSFHELHLPPPSMKT
jgi:hypothetical protein